MKNFFNVRSECIYNPLKKENIIKKYKKKIQNNFFKGKGFLKILNIGRLTKQKDQLTILKSAKILKKKY